DRVHGSALRRSSISFSLSARNTSPRERSSEACQTFGLQRIHEEAVTLPIKLGFERFLRIIGGAIPAAIRPAQSRHGSDPEGQNPASFQHVTTKRLFLLSMSTPLFV